MPKTTKNLEATMRFRISKALNSRVAKIAAKRGCASSDVGREALMTFLESEEQRLGVAKK